MRRGLAGLVLGVLLLGCGTSGTRADPSPTAVVAVPTNTVMAVPTNTAVPVSSPTRAAPTSTPVPPTPTPRSSGRVQLQVPDKYRTGRLAQARELTAPPGFAVSVFAAGMSGPRFMALGPDGTVYVTGLSGGAVYAMRDKGGVADEVRTWATGLRGPHGVAVHDGYLYVGEENRVSRFKIGPNGERASEAQTVVPDLPAGAGHSTRTVGFGPDGKLYVAVGSSCNVCEEKDQRRAAISVYNGDGTAGRVFARGLRNAVGFVWRPGTPQMWATNNGRDNLGDDAPPETVYELHDGLNAGWPRCNPPGTPDPQLGSPTSCQGVDKASVTMQAHMAPLGLRFYDGKVFPQQYRGDLFVAVHGSWNRSVPVGYKVVRVPFGGGDKPIGPAEDFLTGFMAPGQAAWARPVDLLVMPDGAMLVTDDDGGAIFRVYPAGGQA